VLNALIVDDEILARESLREMLQMSGDINVSGECGNAIEAISFIHRERPDVVFLDIQMPRISGLEMVGMIEASALPRIVFVTAYDEFALRAFDEEAVDYLLKPVDPVRLARTLQRLRQGAAGKVPAAHHTAAPLRHIPCMGHQRIFLLPLAEVEYVSSDQCGVLVVGVQQKGVTELTLKILETRTHFLRCHRQFLINPDCIAELVFNELGGADIRTRAGHLVPVSRRYLRELKDQLALA
jgi:two-component system LytT family response regulator